MASRISFALTIAYGAIASMVVIPVAQGQGRPSPDGAAGKGTDTPPVAYESSFKGYRKLEDQPVASWRVANDLVHQLGGWKAFAGGKVPDTPAAPAAAGEPSKPSQPPGPPAGGGHAGHKTQ